MNETPAALIETSDTFCNAYSLKPAWLTDVKATDQSYVHGKPQWHALVVLCDHFSLCLYTSGCSLVPLYLRKLYIVLRSIQSVIPA